MLALAHFFLFGAQGTVFALNTDKRRDAAENQQNDKGHKQPSHNAGHIDPDIYD